MSNQLYIKVPYLRKGKLRYKKVQNIGKRKGIMTFLVDQQYAFQCAPLGDTEQSMTVIRMTIPAGTAVQKGCDEIQESLRLLGYDPYTVLKAMGFTEVIYGATTCTNFIGKETCTECGESRGCTTKTL